MTPTREFLNQEFNKRRTRNPNFSLRSFAKWLGLSPAQLSQMLTGKRPITLKSMKKMGDRLGLSPTEKKLMFTTILKDKNLIEVGEEKKVLHMEEDQFRVISDWYHLAILSLTRISGARADPRWIARRLGISVELAHQALLRLERLGILQVKPKFKQVCDPIEVVSLTPSSAIRKYHKQNLNLAIEKIDTVPLELRQFQSISIPVHPKKLGLYKKLIDEFLEQASELSEKQSGTEVYNLNVQLFPVTQTKENGT